MIMRRRRPLGARRAQVDRRNRDVRVGLGDGHAQRGPLASQRRTLPASSTRSEPVAGDYSCETAAGHHRLKHGAHQFSPSRGRILASELAGHHYSHDVLVRRLRAATLGLFLGCAVRNHGIDFMNCCMAAQRQTTHRSRRPLRREERSSSNVPARSSSGGHCRVSATSALQRATPPASGNSGSSHCRCRSLQGTRRTSSTRESSGAEHVTAATHEAAIARDQAEGT